MIPDGEQTWQWFQMLAYHEGRRKKGRRGQSEVLLLWRRQGALTWVPAKKTYFSDRDQLVVAARRLHDLCQQVMTWQPPDTDDETDLQELRDRELVRRLDVSGKEALKNKRYKGEWSLMAWEGFKMSYFSCKISKGLKKLAGREGGTGGRRAPGATSPQTGLVVTADNIRPVTTIIEPEYFQQQGNEDCFTCAVTNVSGNSVSVGHLGLGGVQKGSLAGVGKGCRPRQWFHKVSLNGVTASACLQEMMERKKDVKVIIYGQYVQSRFPKSSIQQDHWFAAWPGSRLLLCSLQWGPILVPEGTMVLQVLRSMRLRASVLYIMTGSSKPPLDIPPFPSLEDSSSSSSTISSSSSAALSAVPTSSSSSSMSVSSSPAMSPPSAPAVSPVTVHATSSAVTVNITGSVPGTYS